MFTRGAEPQTEGIACSATGAKEAIDWRPARCCGLWGSTGRAMLPRACEEAMDPGGATEGFAGDRTLTVGLGS